MSAKRREPGLFQHMYIVEIKVETFSDNLGFIHQESLYLGKHLSKQGGKEDQSCSSEE